MNKNLLSFAFMAASFPSIASTLTVSPPHPFTAEKMQLIDKDQSIIVNNPNIPHSDKNMCLIILTQADYRKDDQAKLNKKMEDVVWQANVSMPMKFIYSVSQQNEISYNGVNGVELIMLPRTFWGKSKSAKTDIKAVSTIQDTPHGRLVSLCSIHKDEFDKNLNAMRSVIKSIRIK